MSTHHPPFHKTRIVFRYLSGRPLDGRIRTDSRFLRAGTRAFTQTGHASRWAYLPGWKRAAVRIGIPLSLFVSAIGYVYAALLTEISLAGFGTGGIAYGSVKARSAYRVRKHRREYVKPLASVLATILTYPQTGYRNWLSVPIDYATNDDAEIRCYLPVHTPIKTEVRTLITDVVRERLALHDIDASWHMKGGTPYATFKPAPLPPDKVLYPVAKSFIENASDSAPIIGLGRANKPISVDLDSESPHVLFSMSSGAGKSVALRTILSQGLARGAYGIVLDVKRHSHRWARGLPNVAYCRDIADIHETLIRLAEIGEQRNIKVDLIEDEIDSAEVDAGPRIFVLCEEMNATVTRLKRYWSKIRPNGGPKESPAIEALGELLFMGRAVKIHVLAVAQMATARSVGGPEMRENFATRVLGRYSINAWRMLAPEIWPAPKSSRHTGRVQVVIGGEAHETQVAFLTDAEARTLATSGGYVPSVTTLLDQRNDTGNVPGDMSADREVYALDNPNTGHPISVREAIENGILTGTYAAFKKARQRDPEFPKAVGKRNGTELLYRPDDLTRWARNRPNSIAVGE